MPRRKPEPEKPRKVRETIVRKRECGLCADWVTIDFKQPDLLKKFMTERGKILSRKYTGNCARHQRALTKAIKRARVMLMVR
ncbi:MAG: 30S ribosomal protein S18 [Verrucomicrobiae bacterium]|nr:30S ribosomal protein S18 [Verrucomicrobiae bacterium]